ncbi:hypothetical protein HPB51_011206 [Rhipicephalus microplus]|uniref:Uncharacterized protein n=1 Tax=Rhipicephalus microplus TaxID=6941 RepID=A0A9J6F158_RHIMP|nr:hypothetical protein HPB51_011206 [Rhipicephalus microplus]
MFISARHTGLPRAALLACVLENMGITDASTYDVKQLVELVRDDRYSRVTLGGRKRPLREEKAVVAVFVDDCPLPRAGRGVARRAQLSGPCDAVLPRAPRREPSCVGSSRSGVLFSVAATLPEYVLACDLLLPRCVYACSHCLPLYRERRLSATLRRKAVKRGHPSRLPVLCLRACLEFLAPIVYLAQGPDARPNQKCFVNVLISQVPTSNS